MWCLSHSLIYSENNEDNYIEFTLLLHCKLRTKKNAREVDFSGVFEILGRENVITFSFTSSMSIDLLIFS